jgi:hypothetical protein
MGLFHHRHEAEDAYNRLNSGDTPHHEVTHELMAGAAGFEALRLFEKHREKEGAPQHHELAKEMLAGLAAAEVEKLFEKGLYNHLDREKAKQAAQEQASHLYDQQYQQQ